MHNSIYGRVEINRRKSDSGIWIIILMAIETASFSSHELESMAMVVSMAVVLHKIQRLRVSANGKACADNSE